VAGSTLAIASAITPALGNPIPPTPTPTFLFPTASDRTLGFGKWGIGPAAVAVWQGDRLTVGGQIRNYWSVERDIRDITRCKT
jgi:hypothetical protein